MSAQTGVTYLKSVFLHSDLPTLRKHAYSNILKISLPKQNFLIKNIDIFHISPQNIGCEYSLEPPWRGGSNEYPQSVLSKNKKNNVYPSKLQLYYIKVGFKGVTIIKVCFSRCYPAPKTSPHPQLFQRLSRYWISLTFAP